MCNNMDEFHNNVEQKKPDTREYMVYVSIYINTETGKT